MVFMYVRSISCAVQDMNYRPCKNQADANRHFMPGAYSMNHPASYASSQERPHLSVIYPRRDLTVLIATCYPVVNGTVVMRYKPVFTTAGTQAYAGACFPFLAWKFCFIVCCSVPCVGGLLPWLLWLGLACSTPLPDTCT